MAAGGIEFGRRFHSSDGSSRRGADGMKRQIITFSPTRFWAIVVKEFIQMRRDRLTFGMMVGIPLLQLILFGYAINSDPKQLPTAVVIADNGPFGRTLLYAIRNSAYFGFVRQLDNEAQANAVLERGEVQFVVNIPQNFSRDLIRGDRPSVL